MNNKYVYLVKVVEAILESRAIKATAYLSEKEIIRATRKTYGGRIMRGNVEMNLTVGKPNYAEREFVKLLKKSGEPFPVKKIQLKFLKKDRVVSKGSKTRHPNQKSIVFGKALKPKVQNQ